MILLLFFVGLLILLAGYLFYAPFIEKKLNIEYDKPTPAHTMTDGVDYIPLNDKKNMLIQLLNIAGTGPIYGPIMAALFGPVVLILIPLGNVFAGAVMDIGIGVISIKNGGANLPILARKYLGNWSFPIITLFSFILLLLVATVFVVTPAKLIAVSFDLVPYLTYITIAIFAYYILAAILPIDQIIGRFYPYITGILLVGTVAAVLSTFYLLATDENVVLPEITSKTFWNWHPNGVFVIPGLIVAVSCGLISGFHSTQSPIVAKTLNKMTDIKKTFFGMMAAEGVIAMIWAFIPMVLFPNTNLLDIIKEGTQALVVQKVAVATLGAYISWFLVVAVIILPVTSGDTAFRSLRNIASEVINLKQDKVRNRLLLAVPIFSVSIFLMNMGYDLLWSYFTWSNHMLSVLSLMVMTVYLKSLKQNYWVALLPMVGLFFLDMIYLLTDTKVGAGLKDNVSILTSFVIVSLCSMIGLKYSKGWNVQSEAEEI